MKDSQFEIVKNLNKMISNYNRQILGLRARLKRGEGNRASKERKIAKLARKIDRAEDEIDIINEQRRRRKENCQYWAYLNGYLKIKEEPQ